MHPDDAHAWGALATDKNQSDAWGVALNYSTSYEAEKVAVSKCGRNNCKLVRLFANECVAYAADRTSGSSIIGESWGCATREYAENRALDECRSRGGADCVVRAGGCDSWKQKVEKQKTTTMSREPIHHTFDSASGRHFFSIYRNVITARIDYKAKWGEVRKINIDSIDFNTLSCPSESSADSYTIYAKTKMPYEYVIYGQGQEVRKADNEVNLSFNDKQMMTKICNILKGN